MGIDKDKSLSTAATELRRRAEERLRVETAKRHTPLPAEEPQRFVHELEVHQIELEMQNAELRRAQEEFELSQNKYAELYDFSPVGYFTFDARGLIREVNLTGAQLLGIERQLLVNKPFKSFIADADGREIFSHHLETVLQRPGMQRCEIRFTGKAGTVKYGQLQSVSMEDSKGEKGYILSSIVDGTLAKQLETENQDAREYAENIVETVREPLVVLNSDLKILTANHSFYETFKVTPKATIGNFIYDLGNRQWDIPKLRVLFEKILPHDTVFNGYEVEHIFPGIGRKIILLNARQIFRKNIGSHIILLAMEDITERKLAEQALGNSELRYRRLFESAQDGILILNAATGAITDVNPYLIDMLGYSREEFVEKKLWEVGAFKDVEASKQSFQALQKNEFIRYENLPLKTKDGRLVQVEFVSNVYLVGDEKVIQCNIRDISDRKRAEAATLAKEEARLSMLENQEAHWLLIDNLPVGVIVHTPDRQIVLCNPEAAQLLGMAAELLPGKKARDPEWHFLRENGTRMPVAEFPVNQVIATGQVLKNFVMGIVCGQAGESKWVLVNAYPEFDSDESLRQVVVTFADISELKGADARIRRHLEHLTALVEIDRAINFSFDLNLSLTTLLTHVVVQLEVDAADILLFNPTSRTLEYVAGRGFHNKAIEHARQPLGEGYAGRAAQERSLVHIPDLTKAQDSFLRKMLLAGEDFVSYHGMPLIAKGEIVGVLEVFERTRRDRDEEWLDFLKALAAQAAIAIDNVTLFENLQHSNTELFQAYDATIEGWSRALELRDNETEGHTQRVAILTVKLARLFGLSDAEMVQVRWGALLHDIGKMGVPDAILLKTATLTEAEWVVMKKHPVFAYEMLSPIHYLRTALDIPYAHHEKWDGTGYPLGLKGEQIPLVARIFAVVDVWDSLRSNRLYRTSWSVAKVREHLLSLAGTHFDPHVVKVCLDSDVLVD